ncbi:FKBP-type peptidyl-prolyl cis-trans isomerase [soil metagenome]
MKLSALIILIFATLSCSGPKMSTSALPEAPAAPTVPARLVLNNETDSLSYAMGVQTATYYKSQGVDSLNADIVRQAYLDVFKDDSLLISAETSNMTIQQKLQQYMQEKSMKAKESGITFLEENKKRPGVITLPSGLQYEVLKEGTGPVPKASDTVKAHYAGSLIDGTEFDNSYKRGEPLTIPVSGVIQGWVEALQLMPVGSKWKLFIPSDLGYGERGAGGAIPGGAALIFDIELLGIENK